MGCTQGKFSGNSADHLWNIKRESGYVKGSSGERVTNHRQLGKIQGSKERTDSVSEDKHIPGVVAAKSGEGRGKEVVVSETERGRSGGSRNVPKSFSLKKIGEDEHVGGWPKWLVDNVHGDLLEGLVPKSADSYEKLAKIGQGTYSNVYKARDRDTRKIVALKKVRFDTSEPESIKFMAREIATLKRLNHRNVIKLQGLATSRMQFSLYLVFDYMRSDLNKIISRPDGLKEEQVKCYMQQLLSGLQHCHENGILHRDIKPSNLLIDRNGVLKIADFGLANFYLPEQERTNRVVTLWYRAPELLLGSKDYGVGIDLWSAGCVLAEIFVGRPIMPGRSEVEQLLKIFSLCGSPPEEYWKTMKKPPAIRPTPRYKPSFEEVFRTFPPTSFGLLTTLLALDPTSRGSAASALQSEFFTSYPLPCDLSALPAPRKEDETRRGRKKHRTAKAKQSSQEDRDGRLRKDLIEQASGDLEHSKELLQGKSAEELPYSQDLGTSASSTSSSVKTSRHEETLHTSLSPFLRSHKITLPRTEGHHKLKNIEYSTLLQASITDIINPKRDNIFAHHLSSRSEIDFLIFDPEKISEPWGFDKDQATKEDAFSDKATL